MPSINTSDNPVYQLTHNDEVITRAKDVLESLELTKGLGNTTALTSLSDQVILIMPTYEMAKEVQKTLGVESLSLNELPQKLKGRSNSKPLVMDNTAVYSVIRELVAALHHSQPYIRKVRSAHVRGIQL